MLKTIFALMPIQMKLGIGVAAALVIATVIGVIKAQASNNNDLRDKIAVCDTEKVYEKAIYKSELEKKDQMIDDLQEQIKELKINEKQYKANLSKEFKKIDLADDEERRKAAEEYNKDSSCENQLRIIEEKLEEFERAFN